MRMLRVDTLRIESLLTASFALPAGSITTLDGPSGSGKTRLLRAIADLDATSGTVELHGQSRETWSGPDWRRQVAMVAAEPRWWFATAAEHLPGIDEMTLSKLQLKPDALTRPIKQLSTGERQRLNLLRACARDPAVLLLDEPTSALDRAAELAVEAFIRQPTQRAILWVSHDPEQIERITDQRLVIRSGEVHPA